MTITVKKRDNRVEELDINKIHKIVNWACEGLEDVSSSDVEMNAKLLFYDGIPTSDIHNSLIRSACDLVSKDYPNYQIVASRLLSYKLRKDVWGESTPPRLLEHIKKCVELGVYDDFILSQYSESEIHKIGKLINHDNDQRFTHSGLAQLIDKYLVQNRKTKQIYETPQFAYMLIAMTLFASYSKNSRVSYIKKAYQAFSEFKINLPTPIMRNVRTGRKFYSSCTLIDCDDILDSIFASTHAIGRYTASNSGIGLNVGRIRGIDSDIRGGEEVHAGMIPFLKVFESATKSCTQTGTRRGAATVYYPWWHYEIEGLLVLKNNAGTDETRVRKIDYSVVFDKLFLERLRDKQTISLFSSIYVPGLFDAFGTPEFAELYHKYESDKTIPRKTVEAKTIFEIFIRERVETNRIYCMFIDNANNQGSFKDTVRMSNLCCLTGDNLVNVVINGSNCEICIDELVELVNDDNNVYILSKDLNRDVIEYKKVVAGLKTKEVDEVYQILDKDTGQFVVCTGDHEIYTKNRGFVRADELTEEDELDIV